MEEKTFVLRRNSEEIAKKYAKRLKTLEYQCAFALHSKMPIGCIFPQSAVAWFMVLAIQWKKKT